MKKKLNELFIKEKYGLEGEICPCVDEENVRV